MASKPNVLISAIRVTKLFGLYTYRLPVEEAFSNASILYGDNGVGKSTILRLAFHLLSAAGNRGHRTALYQTSFEKFEVDLASGVTVSASRNAQEPKDVLSLSISKDGTLLAVWNYRPRTEASFEASDFGQFEVQLDSDGQSHIVQSRQLRRMQSKEQSVPSGEKAFLSMLEKHMPTIFILNAERRLDSDTVADPSDEVELRRVMHYGEPKRINDLVVRAREIALSQAMNTAGRWIARKAVQAANQGSMNVHSVYVNVLRHLIAPSRNRQQLSSAHNIEDLVQRLTAMEQRTAQYAKYELETPLSTNELRTALQVRNVGKQKIVASLLKPYIESSEGRLRALESIYRIADQFVTTVNGFLSDKAISYTLSHGFSIQNKLEKTLESSQLSSGEQQLLLLFCYVLAGRDQPSVFMIDEPEISLNIKWQRQLIQSLLDTTQDANIQFLFASHSMELLAQHRHRVITLRNMLGIIYHVARLRTWLPVSHSSHNYVTSL